MAYGTARMVERLTDVARVRRARRAEGRVVGVTVEWVILAVVVLGACIAGFGWDRYRGEPGASSGRGCSRRTRCSPTRLMGSGCACGTTRRQGARSRAE